MAIIVGDIHGYVEKAEAFLAYKPEAVHVALGDYLDSFHEPPSRQLQALQLLLDSKAVLLWGNHDLHYLAKPPFICTGFQHGREEPYQSVVEAHKWRFLAAYAIDGWLCTHAGVHVGLAQQENESPIADRLNIEMAEYLCQPHVPGQVSIFAVGGGRGGGSRCGGIFWYDFRRENALAMHIRQIFGHTETKEPVVTATYVALDTTNCAETCYLFDTETNEIVTLKLPLRISPGIDIDWGDDDITTDGEVSQDEIEERRAGLRHDMGVQRAEEALKRYHRGEEDAISLREFIGQQDDLYWAFCDSEKFVIVKAATAREAWTIGAAYWYEGQTIAPIGVLPLNAREMVGKVVYRWDKEYFSAGFDSFFDEW